MPSRQYDRTWVLKISRKFETKIVVFVVFVGLFHVLVSVVGVLGALISVLKISGFCSQKLRINFEKAVRFCVLYPTSA